MKKKKKLSVLKRAQNIKVNFKSMLTDVQESSIKGCKIDLHFNKEAIVDGCKAVSDYGDNRITLNVDGGLIVFEGNNLSLYSFDSGCAIVRGCFTSINFNT